ncbi:MAG: ABC transporter permease [Planctomycetota bacterium]
MSSAATPATTPPLGPRRVDDGRPTRRPRGRSFASIVLGRTAARTGAKLGLAWIVLLILMAVFAPLIANSHPLLMASADGTLSSPMLDHLTPADAGLFAAFVAGLVVLFTPLTISRRLLAVVGVGLGTLIIVGPGWQLIRGEPLLSRPALVVHDQYRESQANGDIKWAINAPIPYSPTDRLIDRGDTRQLEPSTTHLMGTEANGGDMASAMIHAARIALAVGLIATSISLVIGVTIGGLMGYFVGWVDLLGSRLLEIFSAIPVLYLLLTFAAFFPGDPELFPGVAVPRIYVMMAIIGLTGWVGYARFVRAEFLKLRKMDYVASAKTAGASVPAILFRHMLPNGVAPVLVEASFGIASAILAEAFLSFLGLGLLDQPSWGQLLSQALSDTGRFYWWIAMYPGLAIFLTVLALNLIGEAMRDAIDPKVAD